MVALLFMVIFVTGFGGLMFMAHRAGQKRQAQLRPRRVTPKILTPLDNPWGTTAELIAWAERRAVDEHRAAYSDPVTEELQKRFREEFRKGGVIVLEDYDFHTPNEHREQEGLYPRLLGILHGKADGERGNYHWVMDTHWFGRVRRLPDAQGSPVWTPAVSITGEEYLLGLPLEVREGGGAPHLVPNETRESLEQKYLEFDRYLQEMDYKLKAIIGIPGLDVQIQQTRDQRNATWENMKGVIRALQDLYDETASQ